jgi:hypothetical protein
VVPPLLADVGSGSRLPEEGQPFDDLLDDYLVVADGSHTAVDVVPPGGRSLVAPAMLFGCNSGLVAVLALPEGVKAAVARFDDADTLGDDPMTVVDGTDAGGRAWSGGTITTAGGYYLDVTALADGKGSSFVLLTECGD